MRFRTAFAVASVVVLGMFALQFAALATARILTNHGIPFPFVFRILLNIAVFWSHYWQQGIFLILALMVCAASLSSALRKAR